jgi:hypothetical protein
VAKQARIDLEKLESISESINQWISVKSRFWRLYRISFEKMDRSTERISQWTLETIGSKYH